MPKKEAVELIDLSDMLENCPAPKALRKRIETPVEVVYFWTYYKCVCGANKSCPTHGEKPLAKYAIKKLKHGKYITDGYVYYPVPCVGSHPRMPRRIESTEIQLLVCDECLNESHDDMFRSTASPLPEIPLSQDEADKLLFEQGIEMESVNTAVTQQISDAIADTGVISFFDDKETN